MSVHKPHKTHKFSRLASLGVFFLVTLVTLVTSSRLASLGVFSLVTLVASSRLASLGVFFSRHSRLVLFCFVCFSHRSHRSHCPKLPPRKAHRVFRRRFVAFFPPRLARRFFSRLSRCLCCVSFVSFVDNRVRLPPRRDSFFLWIHPFVDARVSARSGRVCSAW